MTERSGEGDRPDYEPHPGDGKPVEKYPERQKDDPHSAPESGDKP